MYTLLVLPIIILDSTFGKAKAYAMLFMRSKLNYKSSWG